MFSMQDLGNICFRYRVAEKDANSFNIALRTALYKEGLSLVGVAYIEGKAVMRLLITNPDATKADVDKILHVLKNLVATSCNNNKVEYNGLPGSKNLCRDGE